MMTAAPSGYHGVMPFSADVVAAALKVVRTTCLSLPEVEERLSHGAPTFFVRGKRTFVMFHDDHHGDGRLALWVAAAPGVQAEMVDEEPDRFFVPPYVGHRGWLGVRLDQDPDWDEVAGVCVDAYRQVAPKTLAARIDGGGTD
jgi:hypothetical protein